jgi:hypothetical protein
MKYYLPFLVFVSILFASCETPTEDWAVNYPYNPTYTGPSIPTGPFPSTPSAPTHPDSTILIDATRDGGLWWYPQGGTFNPNAWHQGAVLADYLRSFGFTVKELPRGAIVSWDEIKNYKNIIRAGNFGNYTMQELLAYDSFLTRSSSLLLIADHLANSSNDNLSQHLGLAFTGSYTGTITPINNHMIITGVNTIPYIAGSVIMQPDGDRMTILGNVNTTDPTVSYAAMGILHHPSSKIFFIGDGNGLQQLPQPFAQNLVKWLFNR